MKKNGNHRLHRFYLMYMNFNDVGRGVLQYTPVHEREKRCRILLEKMMYSDGLFKNRRLVKYVFNNAIRVDTLGFGLVGEDDPVP